MSIADLPSLCNRLLEVGLAACADQKYVLIFEDGLRVAIFEALMAEEGVVLQVPSTKGTASALVALKNGAFSVDPVKASPGGKVKAKGKRGRKKGSRSADIQLTSPLRCLVEIKTRGEFGSNDQHNGKKIAKDIDQAATGNAVAILAADLVGYDAWRGNKKKKAGAKASYSFEALLPPSDRLTAKAGAYEGTWNGTAMVIHAAKVQAPWSGRSRAVAVIRKK